VATDYLRVFLAAMQVKYRIHVPIGSWRAPVPLPEGQDYFAAMKCAVNMSFVNRQVILHRIREVFSEVFGKDPKDIGMRQVYDVSHNTAKIERHVFGGNRGNCSCTGRGDPGVRSGCRGSPMSTGRPASR